MDRLWSINVRAVHDKKWRVSTSNPRTLRSLVSFILNCSATTSTTQKRFQVFAEFAYYIEVQSKSSRQIESKNSSYAIIQAFASLLIRYIGKFRGDFMTSTDDVFLSCRYSLHCQAAELLLNFSLRDVNCPLIFFFLFFPLPSPAPGPILSNT